VINNLLLPNCLYMKTIKAVCVALDSSQLNYFFKSVHHHAIQINHQLEATISPVYYPDVYLQFNMFRASSRPSSRAQQLQ
jgi:hypothetical protein